MQRQITTLDFKGQNIFAFVQRRVAQRQSY